MSESDCVLQEIIETFGRLIREWADKRDHTSGLLYHYTTAEGLQSIVGNGELWATDALFLNDTAEFTHGADIAVAVCEELARSASDPARNLFNSTVIRFRHPERLYEGDQAYTHPFVTCFCESGDLLSQWRGYARAADGYSLGFHAPQLEALGVPGHFVLMKATYSSDVTETRIRMGAVELGDVVTRLAHAHPSVDVAALADWAITAWINACCSVAKHPAFDAEAEWRLIRQNLTGPAVDDFAGLKLRARGGLLTPYRTVRLWDIDKNTGKAVTRNSVLREIITGPQVDPALAKHGIERLFARHSIPFPAISKSNVPYRSQ